MDVTSFHPFSWTDVLEATIGGVVVAGAIALIGLIIWFVRMKPVIMQLGKDLKEKIDKKDLEVEFTLIKKEIALGNSEWEKEFQLIKKEIERKQDIRVCLPMREGCNRTFLQHFADLERQILGVTEMTKEGVSALTTIIEKLTDRFDKWMQKNGGR